MQPPRRLCLEAATSLSCPDITSQPFRLPWTRQPLPPHRLLVHRRHQWVVGSANPTLSASCDDPSGTPLWLEHPRAVDQLAGLLLPVLWRRREEPLLTVWCEATSSHHQSRLNLLIHLLLTSRRGHQCFGVALELQRGNSKKSSNYENWRNSKIEFKLLWFGSWLKTRDLCLFIDGMNDIWKKTSEDLKTGCWPVVRKHNWHLQPEGNKRFEQVVLIRLHYWAFERWISDHQSINIINEERAILLMSNVK